MFYVNRIAADTEAVGAGRREKAMMMPDFARGSPSLMTVVPQPA